MKKNTKSKYSLYGIPNCDTVKKVRGYLEKNKITYEMIDFKKTPPSESDIKRWKSFMKTWPANTKGPTYRKIREQFESATDTQKIKILIENSSAIKRPILEIDGLVEAVGFDKDYYI